jgi:hypothetical protein
LEGGSARREAATYTHNSTNTEQTSMSLVGFELTIPVFERPKIFHASDHTATVFGKMNHQLEVIKDPLNLDMRSSVWRWITDMCKDPVTDILL